MATHSIPSLPRFLYRLELFFFDLALLLFAFLWVTGGVDFLHQDVLILIKQKPWLHRMAMMYLSIVVICWYGFRTYSGQQSFLNSRLLNLRVWQLPPLFWTHVIFVAMGSLWSFSSWARHDAFQSSFDMAIFTQAIWNTLQGNILYSSIKGGICLLADHFSPILFFYVPFYAIFPDPKVLLMLQAFIAASAVYPLYKIANSKLNSRWALAFVIAFVNYLPVRNAVRFDFHPEIIALPAVLWAFYFIDSKKMGIASVICFVVLVCKENAVIATTTLAVYSFIKGNRSFGLFWIMGSILYFFFIVHFIIPIEFNREYFYLSGNYSSWFHQSPAALIAHVFSVQSMLYLVKIFLPVGGLCFLTPLALLNLLPLVQNIFTSNLMVRSIFFHYTIFLTPFVFISAIIGARKLFPKSWGVFYLITSTLLFAGVSDQYVLRDYLSHKTDGPLNLQTMIAMVPEAASLRTHERIAPHVANRHFLHIYENTNPLEGGSLNAMKSDYILIYKLFFPDTMNSVIDSIRMMSYDLYSESEDLLLFKRSISDHN